MSEKLDALMLEFKQARQNAEAHNLMMPPNFELLMLAEKMNIDVRGLSPEAIKLKIELAL